MMLRVFVHLLFTCTLLPKKILGSFLNSGIEFQDSFEYFDLSRWNQDSGVRHCGSKQCVWTSPDNLNYISTADELRISLRNDCDNQVVCCKNNAQCTTFTAGQVTSKQFFLHGSFQFALRTSEQIQDYHIESVSFKSIQCISSPSPYDFPQVLSGTPTAGYCVNNEPDLTEYHSNRDLCQGVGSNICARYRWEINVLRPGIFHFKAISYGWTCTNTFDFISGVEYEQRVYSLELVSTAVLAICKHVCLTEIEDCVAIAHQKHPTQQICAFYRKLGKKEFHSHQGSVCTYVDKAIDYVTSAIFVDGRMVASGERSLLQDFEISLKTKGVHSIEVYGYEDCCAGHHELGYKGWTLTRRNIKFRFPWRKSGSNKSSPKNLSPEGTRDNSDTELTGGAEVSDEGEDRPPVDTTTEPAQTTEEATTPIVPTVPEVAEEARETEPEIAAISLGDRRLRIPLIVDCDGAFDDSMGVIIAYHMHQIGMMKLKGITLTPGVTDAINSWNAINVILKVFQAKDIPIYGMHGPGFSHERQYGDDGHFGQVNRFMFSHGIMFPITRGKNAQEFICEQLFQEPYLVILTTGPLTNLHACHHLLKPTHTVFIMGGAMNVTGNIVTPRNFGTEFNFASNPSAVRDVISHGNSIIIPLDCRMRFFTSKLEEAIKQINNRFLKAVFTRYLSQVYRTDNGDTIDFEFQLECITIHGAAAAMVMHSVLFNKNIDLFRKGIGIDDRGKVIDGSSNVWYCGEDSFNPLSRLFNARMKSTIFLIAALWQAKTDFMEPAPSLAPSFWIDQGSSSSNFGQHSPEDSNKETEDRPSPHPTRYEDAVVDTGPNFYMRIDVCANQICPISRQLLCPSDIVYILREDWNNEPSMMPHCILANALRAYRNIAGRNIYGSRGHNGSAGDGGVMFTDPLGRMNNRLMSLDDYVEVHLITARTPTLKPSIPAEFRDNDGGSCSTDIADYVTTDSRGTGVTSDEVRRDQRKLENLWWSWPNATGISSNYIEYGAQLCAALMVAAAVRIVSMQISMCFNSWNTKQATLLVKNADNIWRNTVDLPFDASSNIGSYRIDWLPDRIIWRCGSEKIGEVRHDIITIPNESMRMKFFVVPKDAMEGFSHEDILVEHQMHLYGAGYNKFISDKTELFVLPHKRNSWSVIASILLLVLSIISVCTFFYQEKHQAEVPYGYEQLLDDSDKETSLNL